MLHRSNAPISLVSLLKIGFPQALPVTLSAREEWGEPARLRCGVTHITHKRGRRTLPFQAVAAGADPRVLAGPARRDCGSPGRAGGPARRPVPAPAAQGGRGPVLGAAAARHPHAAGRLAAVTEPGR